VKSNIYFLDLKGGRNMSNEDLLLMKAACFVLIITVVYFILDVLSHIKALKALGYNKPWLAWFAPLGLYWALAEAALDIDGEYDMEVWSFRIPGTAFKLWYLIAVAVLFIPVVGTILRLIITIACAGTCYIKIYAKLDGKDESEVRLLGYLSGIIPIIPIFKFLIGKYRANKAS